MSLYVSIDSPCFVGGKLVSWWRASSEFLCPSITCFVEFPSPITLRSVALQYSALIFFFFFGKFFLPKRKEVSDSWFLFYLSFLFGWTTILTVDNDSKFLCWSSMQVQWWFIVGNTSFFKDCREMNLFDALGPLMRPDASSFHSAGTTTWIVLGVKERHFLSFYFFGRMLLCSLLNVFQCNPKKWCDTVCVLSSARNICLLVRLHLPVPAHYATSNIFMSLRGGHDKVSFHLLRCLCSL